MKLLTHWVLALLTITAVASLTGAWTAPQEPAQQEKSPGQTGRKAKPRSERLAAIKKAVPDLKTSLTEAITLAEKETTGKAIAAELEIISGKPFFQVTLIVKDELTTASVNATTKKIVVGANDAQGGAGKGN